jgi:phospholipid/cholesterol/gamma-HCH transport system permease protein
MSKAEFTIDAPADGKGAAVLSLKGQWVLTQLGGVAARLRRALTAGQRVRVAGEGLEGMDTAGAFVLRSAIEGRVDGPVFPDNEKHQRLYDLVGARAPEISGYHREKAETRRFWHHPVFYLLVDIGHKTMGFWKEAAAHIIFMGHVIALTLIAVGAPMRLRWAAMVNIMQRAGVDAVGIVVITNAFIGGVLAFLGVIELQQFGVAIYAVETVGVAVMREFAPVVTAVLLAGRSASSFAAEIGSMKMNQEIDAMEVMNIDPYEALVLPRTLAMIVMTPLVTFLGVMAGLAGGALVIWTVLGLGPQFFVSRMADNVPFQHFWVGLAKTPFFAAIIALVGCRRGLTVKGDVISLGRQVTTAVVHAIFLIFMLDAIFAVVFQQLDL